MVRKAFFLLFFLLCVGVVVAPQPVFQESSAVTTLTVIYPKLYTHEVGEQLKAHAHVFSTTGRPVYSGTVGCVYHLYNESDAHVLKKNMSFSYPEWELVMGEGNFTRVGELSYLIYCSNTTIGGYVSGSFHVTLDGVDESDKDLWPVGVFVLIPFLLSFLLVLGAGLFDPDEHPMIRVGLFFGSLMVLFGGLWFAGASIIKFYDWQAGVSALGTLGFVLGGLLLFLFVYWFLYIITRALEELKARRGY